MKDARPFACLVLVPRLSEMNLMWGGLGLLTSAPVYVLLGLYFIILPSQGCSGIISGVWLFVPPVSSLSAIRHRKVGCGSIFTLSLICLAARQAFIKTALAQQEDAVCSHNSLIMNLSYDGITDAYCLMCHSLHISFTFQLFLGCYTKKAISLCAFLMFFTH